MQKRTDTDLRWLVLLTVIVGTFLGRLDQTIVSLALPKIMDDFSITLSEAGWIATAYILANAVFVPIWGKLGDTVGRKKVYLAGFAMFIVGSILAGLSWDLGSMLVFRVIQAIAGSADYPTAMAILTVTFADRKERAQALGIWSASFAAAVVFGPLIGGPLIDAFGWRSIFLINLPIGLIGIIMAMLFIDESVSESKTKSFDWKGALTLGIALSALVLVLDKGLEWGWLSTTSLSCYATMLVFAYLFYSIERNHPEPIVDLKFFQSSAFVSALANNFIVFLGMMGCVFIIPIYLQTFLGYSATETGYIFIPMAFGMMLGAPIGASLVGKVPSRYVIAASTFGAAFGMFLFTGLDPRSSALDVIIPLFVMAFSIGFAMSQRTNIIASIVPESEIGSASSTLALVRNIAGAFGIALFATIQKDAMENALILLSQNSHIFAPTPEVIQQAVMLMALKAQIISFRVVFLAGALVLLLGGILALLTDIRETDAKARREVIVMD
ncbi:MAG: DHA2 family efflux MFS transporter permease subunit [Candidatus Micrarchaeia archaeon]